MAPTHSRESLLPRPCNRTRQNPRIQAHANTCNSSIREHLWARCTVAFTVCHGGLMTTHSRTGSRMPAAWTLGLRFGCYRLLSAAIGCYRLRRSKKNKVRGACGPRCGTRLAIGLKKPSITGNLPVDARDARNTRTSPSNSDSGHPGCKCGFSCDWHRASKDRNISCTEQRPLQVSAGAVHPEHSPSSQPIRRHHSARVAGRSPPPNRHCSVAMARNFSCIFGCHEVLCKFASRTGVRHRPAYAWQCALPTYKTQR